MFSSVGRYFFYRVVLGITHFGTLQTLAVYVILGIGADDIFVLYDAFCQVWLVDRLVGCLSFRCVMNASVVLL